MNHFIMDLLNIKLDDCELVNYTSDDKEKTLYIEMLHSPKYCEVCNCRLESKGLYWRKINHPILQDGYSIIVYLHQRRWKCNNCNYTMNEGNSFVSKYKRNSIGIPVLIINELKCLDRTITDVAKHYNLSDTTVHNYFNELVSADRLILPRILSVDEVYLNVSPEEKYALVIMDFEKRKIVDLVPSRRNEYTSKYFYQIPLEERKKVKYLISDMYNPYIQYIDNYFPEAKNIVDSYHVVATLLLQIRKYIFKVRKNYDTKSDEYYLLKKFNWIMLSIYDSIHFYEELRYDHHFKYSMNTRRYVEKYMAIDSSFDEIHELKEKFILFNKSETEDKEILERNLDALILKYIECPYSLFNEFAELLLTHKDAIIRSFIKVEVCIGKDQKKDYGAPLKWPYGII